jgi:hypothetical protein
MTNELIVRPAKAEDAQAWLALCASILEGLS